MTPKQAPKMTSCVACDGRGIRAVATEDVVCAACDGKGAVKAEK